MHIIYMEIIVNPQFLIFFLLFFSFDSPFAFSDESNPPIDIYVYERPPLYNIKGSNHVTGLVVAPAKQAFETAKIPFRC